MSDSSAVDRLNKHRPAFILMLGGEVLAFDAAQRACTIGFDVERKFCHSGDVVQGGFVTAMLDATMAHACFGLLDNLVNVATLEIKVSFFEPSRAGRFRCVGRVRKFGRNIGFMEGELHGADGALTATATTTAKLVRAK